MSTSDRHGQESRAPAYVTFLCPNGHHLKAFQSAAGHKVRCAQPACGVLVVVPASSTAPAQPAADPEVHAEVTPAHVSFLCPNGHRLKAKRSAAGQKLTCAQPGCGAEVTVPRESTVPPPPPRFTPVAPPPAPLRPPQSVVTPQMAGPSHLIPSACPNGHWIQASAADAGRSIPCPVPGCGTTITVQPVTPAAKAATVVPILSADNLTPIQPVPSGEQTPTWKWLAIGGLGIGLAAAIAVVMISLGRGRPVTPAVAIDDTNVTAQVPAVADASPEDSITSGALPEGRRTSIPEQSIPKPREIATDEHESPGQKRHSARDEKENTAHEAMKVDRGILQYTPNIPDLKLADNERLCFLVLVSHSGNLLDETVARAGGDGAMRFSGLANASVAESQVIDRKEGKVIGTKYVVYDTRREAISHKKTIQLEVGEAGVEILISAAVGVFDSNDPDFRFARFLTPVSNIVTGKKEVSGGEEKNAEGSAESHGSESATEGESGASISASAADLLAKVIHSADIPALHNDEIAAAKSRVTSWQKAIASKKTTDPVSIYSDNQNVLSPFVTPAVVEKALGKPDRQTKGEIPFLFTQQGAQVEGPILWYGEIGFCFGFVGLNGKRDNYLFMMTAQPK